MSTKKCSKCHKILPVERFGKISTRFKKDGSPVLKSRCKKCLASDQAAWVDIRGDDYREYRQEYESNWRYHQEEHLHDYESKRNINRRELWRKFMADKKCAKCGMNDSRCLQWHHRDPSQKSFTITSAFYCRRKSWKSIMDEVSKCECLCANCHFITHAELRQT